MNMTPVEVIVNRVLIVDDDRDQAEVLKTLLEANKYSVELAKDAGQAHVAFTMHRPDFVILDLVLPNNVSGFEVCEKMKRLEGDVPILIVSAIDMDDARDLAQRVGADGYLVKPYDPDVLLAQIRILAENAWRRKHSGAVTTSQAKVRFSCPACGKHLKVSASHRGRTLNCPKCGQPVSVPIHD
ncbi:MAG: response regulator [Planctomycetaceae bacterium]|nr:response regulator [Planctomycetaceae bacterium]